MLFFFISTGRKMIIFILFISYAVPSTSIEMGSVVPHAEELHDMISRNVPGFNTTEPGSIIDFILNGNAAVNSNIGLDTSILDPSGIKKIVEKAWREHRGDGLEDESLMWDMFPKDTPEQKDLIDRIKNDYRRNAGRSGLRNSFGYQQLDVVANIALRQMKQSLYSTKERLEATSTFRSGYGYLPSYKVALYTAMVHQNIEKMTSYYVTMESWYKYWGVHNNWINRNRHSIHFLWYLIFYEKVLACNVDVTDAVRRVIALHQEYMASNPAIK